MNRSRRELFGVSTPLDFHEILAQSSVNDQGVIKCKVVYGRSAERVEYAPYTIRTQRSLQLVRNDEIDYAYKYLDRSIFDRLLEQCAADDLLIVKQGMITDTSYANIVFLSNNGWITPASPLLRGTRREELLQKGLIREAPITPADLPRYSEATIINSMLDLGEGPRFSIAAIHW